MHILESIPALTESTGPHMWLLARWSFNVGFTLESALRIYTYVPFRDVYRDLFLWNDIGTSLPFWLRLAFEPQSLEPRYYLDMWRLPFWVRLLEAYSTFRIFKACRYYDGAVLLYEAFSSALAQLTVPFYMFLLLIFCFAAILLELEYDAAVGRCAALWRAQGISSSFLYDRADGISWGCDACADVALELPCNASVGGSCSVQRMLCDTCERFPPGHPECEGLPLAQTFRDMLGSMWFMVVTLTTVGYGDLTVGTTPGRFFVSFVICCGVTFVAMPIAIVGRTFTSTWDAREQRKLQARVRQLLVSHGMSRREVQGKLNESNTSGDGVLRVGGLSTFFNAVAPGKLSKADVAVLYKSLLTDGATVVTIDDFLRTLFPDSKSTKRRSSAMSVLQASSNGGALQRGGDTTPHAGSGLSSQQLELIMKQSRESTQSLRNFEKRLDGFQDSTAFRIKTVEQRLDRVHDHLGELISMMRKQQAGGLAHDGGAHAGPARDRSVSMDSQSWNPLADLLGQRSRDPTKEHAAPSTAASALLA